MQTNLQKKYDRWVSVSGLKLGASVAALLIGMGLGATANAQIVQAPQPGAGLPENPAPVPPAPDPGNPAQAQTEAPGTPSAPAESSNQLGDIVVTARYVKETVQQSPIAISAVSGADIASRGYTNVADISRTMPNVSLQPTDEQYGKGLSAFIRGVGQISTGPAFSPAVGSYIDGVYVDTISGANTALFDVDRIEVLRGPQGTLFGANSESGAIVIDSVLPKGDNSGFVKFGYGSYNHLIGQGVFDVPLSDTLYLRAGFTAEKQDGYEKRIDYVCANPGNRYTGTLKATGSPENGCVIGSEGRKDTQGLKGTLRWIPSGNLEIDVRADFTNDTGSNPATKLLSVDQNNSSLQAANANFTAAYGGQGYGPWFITPSKYTSYSCFCDPVDGVRDPTTDKLRAYGFSETILWNPGSINVKSITAYRYSKNSYSHSFGGATSIGENFETNLESQLSQEVDVSGRALSDKLDWTIGAFYFHNSANLLGDIDIPAFGTLAPLTTYADPGGETYTTTNAEGYLHFTNRTPIVDTNKSIFGHIIYHITRKLSLEAGVRYTDERKTFNLIQYDLPLNVLQFNPPIRTLSPTKRVDPKVGLKYQWTPTFMTYASYSTGFKSGGVNPEVTQTRDQADAFGAETLKNYEIGAKSEFFDHHVRLNGDIFYMDYRGLQIQSSEETKPYVLNIGHAVIEGAEMVLDARVFGGLSINASTGYLHYDLKNCGEACYDPVTNPAGVPQGAVAPQTPKFKYDIGIEYAYDLGKLGAITPRLDYTHKSSVYNDVANTPAARQPAYGVANLNIGWTDNGNKWGATFAITNLFDKNYYYGKYVYLGVITGDPGDPREFMLSLTRNF